MTGDGTRSGSRGARGWWDGMLSSAKSDVDEEVGVGGLSGSVGGGGLSDTAGGGRGSQDELYEVRRWR